MGVVVGVDSSTQSCTVEVRNSIDGRLLGTGRSPHPATAAPVSEQDPQSWWEALVSAFGRALSDANLKPNDVDAMSVAAQCHGLVMLDRQDRVMRPAKLWNDTTSSDEAHEMVADIGAAEWSQRVGSVPTAAFTITKLAWVARHEPQHLESLRRVLLPHDYLTYRLTGSAVTDRSEASGTGYYSAHDATYLIDHLQRWVSDSVDWATSLPRVGGPSEAAGIADTTDSQKLGLRPDVVVGVGAGDQHAAALGIGLASGQVLYSLGTSGVVMTTSSTPVFDDTALVNGVADATGQWLPLSSTLNCTKVTDMFARLLGVDHEALAQLALAAPRRPDRAVLAAYLDGERMPDRPKARGLLSGLRTDASREEIALAAFEGVVLGLVSGHRAIQRAGADADGTVVVTGGGARSRAYRQVLADSLGKNVEVREAPEATARGAAIQAAAVLAAAEISAVRDAWTPPLVGMTDPAHPVDSIVAHRYATITGWTQPEEQLERASPDTVS